MEAREAVSLNPQVAVAVLALGEALLAADALPTAIAELQRALRLDPLRAGNQFHEDGQAADSLRPQDA